MNKHHLGLVIYQQGQPQVKILDDDFNRSTMFAVGLTPAVLPARILAHEYLLDIDMGLNRNLFRTSSRNAPKSDWFNPRVDYFEKIIVCFYIGIQDSLVRSPRSHDFAVTDLYFTLWNLLKMVGSQPGTLEIKFYNEQGKIVHPYNDVIMEIPAQHRLEKLNNTAEVMAVFSSVNEPVFHGIVANYHAANYRFVFDIPHTTLKALLLFTDGDHLKLHQLVHNVVAERFQHNRLKITIELKTHHVMHSTQPEYIPMRSHTQQPTYPEISSEIKSQEFSNKHFIPEQSVNTIVWNSDLVYRATAQITDMRFNEICRAPDEPAIDWEQVIGRIVMTLSNELSIIISILHSENTVAKLVLVPPSYQQKLKDMLNRAFNYMQLTFEELPMGKEQLLYAKAQVGASKLSIVYTSSNGIQAPSFAGYQPAPFDPRSYGPLQPQPFQMQSMADTEYMRPRNPAMTPFVPPHVHSPVHMNPRSPDFGGRRPSRGSVNQPEYSNRMNSLHNGPVRMDMTIVGSAPDPMQQYSGEMDTHVDSGDD